MAKVPEYEDRLSKFERMCVVKTFREDRTLVAASEYVADSLGQRFVESVPLNMERAWAESHKRCPLICLLSRGSDPTKLIEDLAKRKKIKACLLHFVPPGRVKCTQHLSWFSGYLETRIVGFRVQIQGRQRHLLWL